MLGPGKDQRVLRLQLFHQKRQKLGLIAPVYEVYGLVDGIHRGGYRIYRDLDWILQQRVYQLGNLRGHGSREKERLLLLGQPLEYFFTSWIKPISSIRSASSRTKISR